MPLYMDIHTVDSDEFSAEDVVKAHMEDLAIQDKFGVKQLKYFPNGHVKKEYAVIPKRILEDPIRLKKLVDQSIRFVS